ncbi:MAG: pentapeptide repeat-containing protein, partial [Vulcanimicrobiaceae bacterium]
MLKRLIAVLVCTIGGIAATAAADQTSLTVAQVRAALHAAHPPAHANFSGKALHNLNLDGLDFSGVNFSNADLLETSFRSATLTGANFESANLSDVKFDNARLQHANLTGTTLLTGAANADMRGVNLSRAEGYLIASGANLTGANLSLAKLSPVMSNQPMGQLHTILSQADLSGANLSGTDLTSANCENAKFAHVNAR